MKFPNVGQKRSEGSGAGNLFLKLKNGERVKGVFVGEPVMFRTHWDSGRSHVCPGKATCEHCKLGEKPRFRFRLNFLTSEGGTWLAKIFEGSYGTFLELKEMHESDYVLPETCVILARTGDRTDTRYRVTPAKDNGGLKPLHFKKLQAIPLNDLSPERPDEEGAVEDAVTADASEEVLPF